MRRGIAQLSLFAALAFFVQPSAIPWREKNAFKIATTLPARLIDSIMAQGNWNILFQEGPFNEFQRHIAIANHFALRGDNRLADFYLKKAGAALDIAYASLRGRFGWPRNASEQKAAALAWGENRDTFEDFLLCRLQLQIELTLLDHESGVLAPAALAQSVAEVEKQLSTPVRQKDADLEQIITVIREAAVIRTQKENNVNLRAARFAALSDRIVSSARNYWSRKLTLFRVLENIHHGNLGRAFSLIKFLEDKQKDQIDAYNLARIYIRLGAYRDALGILQRELKRPELKTADNFAEFAAFSSLSQSLLIWLSQINEATALSAETTTFLAGLAQADAVPREEAVDLKKSLANERLRGKMLVYLKTGRCPELGSYTADTDMEIEWQARERIFYENCGLTRNKSFWTALQKQIRPASELKGIISYHLGDAISLPAKADASPLLRYLVARRALQKAPGRPELALAYLRQRNLIQSEFALFDWGLNLADDLTDRALEALPRNLPEKTARPLFAELHRRYVDKLSHTGGAFLFSPADAVHLTHKSSAAMLDQGSESGGEETYPGTGKVLLYADTVWLAVFDPTERKQKFRISKRVSGDVLPQLPGKGRILFGAAINELSLIADDRAAAHLPPYQNFCPDCGKAQGKSPERLVILNSNRSLREAYTNELADNFSLVAPPGSWRECGTAATRFEDALLATADATGDFSTPCDLSADKIVLEYDTTAATVNNPLLFATGWRPGLAVVLMPRELPQQIKTSFLFDFFQRINRRQTKAGEAFREAKTRAEKSFPSEAALRRMYLYESLD